LVERGWQAARDYSLKADSGGVRVLHIVKGRVARPVRRLMASSASLHLLSVARVAFWPVAWSLSVWLFLCGKLQAVLVDNERSFHRVRRWFPGAAVPIWELHPPTCLGFAAGEPIATPAIALGRPPVGQTGGGTRIALIFDKTRPDTTGIYVERACRTLGLSCDHWWLRDVASIPPRYDLYLRVDHGDDYLVLLPRRLRPAIFYAIDTHLPNSWRKIRRAADRYDLVCCAQRAASNRLANAEWLPLGCDWELHGRQEHAPRWDVACVGTEGGIPRKFYLQALRERYPKSFIGTAASTELSAIYSQARVGFNYSIADDVNMRVFEVLAAGALLVTNALPQGDLTRLGLEDRRHLILYRAPDELVGVIDDFLAHPEERRAIAQAGCDLARARHTYVHRMTHLLETASRRLGLTWSSPEQRPQVQALGV